MIIEERSDMVKRRFIKHDLEREAFFPVQEVPLYVKKLPQPTL